MKPNIIKSFLAVYILSQLFLLSQPLNSESPSIYNKRGVEFGKQKRYKQALKEFDKSIDIYNNSSSKVYHNKAWVLEIKGNQKEAIKFYEEAIKRNPLQIPSYERVGYLYYKTGEYSKAVDSGEYVIKIDPKNQEVIKWLPDAYRLKLRKQQEDQLAKKDVEEEKKEGKEEEKAIKEEKKEKAAILYATFDFMLRTAYYFRGSEGYKYVTTPGLYANVPEMLYIKFTPVKEWEFDLKMGNPYLGALSPNLVIHTENLQAIYHMGKYLVGIGVLGNHYRNYFNFDGRKHSLSDYKIGFIFGVEQKKSIMRFSLYPRAIPHDTQNSSGKTLDVDYLEYNFKYMVDKLLSYYSRISVADYFFFDHDNETSNYWGVYEISLGLIISKYDLENKFLTVTIDFTERLYMRDLNNEKPYNFGNGQGWFGINTDKWFKGDPFPGYRAPGHVFSIKIEERIHDNYFFYQKLIFEMVDRAEDHNEICLQMGMGGNY